MAFKLLKNAGLNEECSRIVRIACSTNTSAPDAESLTFANMKATILNAFDCRLDIKGAGPSSCNSDATGTTSVEPFQIKSEPQETFYSRHREKEYADFNSVYEQQVYQGKARGSGRDYNGKMNRGRYSRDPYPSTKPGREIEKMKDSRVNRVDRYTGKPSECRLCGSIYHCGQLQSRIHHCTVGYYTEVC